MLTIPDSEATPVNFQQLILKLSDYWTGQGCILEQPYDVEKGAGTFNHATFLRTLGPEPWKVAYVEPSRRPTDGRYGDNPFRTEKHYQFQVILKPAPANAQQIYLESLRAVGIDVVEHDLRFIEDDWESPTLGATGLGWQVWLDGLEVTQFTYFQQVAGFPCDPVCVEYTYGLERVSQFIQNVDNIYDLEWAPGVTYGDVRRRAEYEFSKYNFEVADVAMLRRQFEMCEDECKRLANERLVLPAYDYLLRCSHTFNVLDARRAISVTERAATIARTRGLARKVGAAYLQQREEMGFPLLERAEAAAGTQA